MTRKQMARMVYSKRYAAGDVIIRMGDRARHAYIIEQGRVEVSAQAGSRKVVIAELGKGEIFGEMSVIDDAPRSATVTALEDTDVVVMQRSRFQRPLAAADPIMNMLLRVVLARFRSAQQLFLGNEADPNIIDASLQEIRDLAHNRIQTEKAMRQGLEANAFHLHYQPIVSLDGGHIAGFEALMRWHTPDGIPVSPATFIPLAEEIGMIAELGRWALETAISDHREFTRTFRHCEPGLPPPFMSVNVSGLQLSEMSEIEHLADIIGDSGVDPACIKLEITETLLVQDPDHAADALAKLKELGVSIAIDDFGTGYSSLSYLHQFPLDTLKIDRSFVTNMNQSTNSHRIVRSIAQLALALEMDIVAEGIEEQAQMDILQALGCHHGQGFYMARPAPADDTVSLINRRPRYIGETAYLADAQPEATSI